MNFETITKDNFLIYATKCYDSNQCADIDEFNLDLNKFCSIKRLLLRWNRNNDDINIRLLVNHIIVTVNLFSIKATPKLLFYYCPEETHPQLFTILDFLGIMPKDKFKQVDTSKLFKDNNMLYILERL